MHEILKKKQFLPDHSNNSEFYRSIKTYHVFMLTVEPSGKKTNMVVASCIVDTLLRRQLLQNHLIVNLAVMKNRRF